MALDLIGRIDIVSAFAPIDMESADHPDTTHGFFDMSKYDGCLAVVFKGVGTASDDPVITLKQATDNAGTGLKALNFVELREKIGATDVRAIAQWTRKIWNGSAFVAATAGSTPSGTSPTNTYTQDSAEFEAFCVINVKSSDLDVANKFNHIQISVPDTGSAGAELGCAFYIGYNARYAEDPEQSAIG